MIYTIKKLNGDWYDFSLIPQPEHFVKIKHVECRSVDEALKLVQRLKKDSTAGICIEYHNAGVSLLAG